METFMLHNIMLTEHKQIAPNLWSGRDRLQMLRIHNGEFFRGYTFRTRNRKQEIIYGYQVWGDGDGQSAVQFTKWKTTTGAEKALIEHAIKLNPPSPPPAPTKSPTKPICRYCKSENVTLDALATWNVEKQVWELQTTYDSGACGDCEATMKYFDWIEVKDDDADNSTTQPSDRTGETVQQESVDPADQG